VLGGGASLRRYRSHRSRTMRRASPCGCGRRSLRATAQCKHASTFANGSSSHEQLPRRCLASNCPTALHRSLQPPAALRVHFRV